MSNFDFFLKSLSELAQNNNATWLSYVVHGVIGEDSEVTFVPVTACENKPSADIAELAKYCSFLLGQGFKLQVYVEDIESKVSLHIVSFENYEYPEWPVSKEFSFVLECPT